MIASQISNTTNGVNGSTAEQRVPAPGRNVHSRWVTFDRQRATAGGSTGHAQRVSGGRDRATARTDCARRIATWNVNTLYQAGKFENLKKEARRMNLDVIGVSEVRWTGSGKLVSEDWVFYYSGGDAHQHGVGIMIKKEMDEAVSGCWQLSSRVMLLKLEARPVPLNIIQVYAPTSVHSDEVIDEFYEQLEEARRQCKPNEVTVVMGDLNAKVGEGRSGEVVGKFGLGERNERGTKWVEWCESWNQVIMNTTFRHHPRFLYTWKSPGDRYRNQIDYITVNKRFRNSITQVKTRPGADCGVGCDHVPVVALMKVKLKRIKKNRKRRKDWNVLRRETSVKDRYRESVGEKLRSSEEGEDEQDVNQDWKVLQEALVLSAEEIIPNERPGRKQPWMTEEILSMMEMRRVNKNVSEEVYKQIDRRIKAACRERKNEWLEEKCQEVEELERIDSRMMAEKIREITGKKRTCRSTIIKDRDGTILTERSEVLNRWQQYVGDLYKDEDRGMVELDEIDRGPPILRSELEEAIRKMKWRKAEGSDGIVVEMVEAAGDIAITKILKLANRIYECGEIPEMMKESEFIVIPKKEGATDCEKHRTICIMSQVAKMVLKVIGQRLKAKVEEFVDEEQYGFRKGKGTREAIQVLRTIIERSIEKQKDLFMCFVDFEKAFDTVKHGALVETLKKYGVEGADLRIIAKLYWEQRAVVRVEDEKSGYVEIEKGVRQGCVLSPDLFSLYTQLVMDELAELEGISIGGRNINNIRYADDMVLIADSEEKLQRLISKLHEECNAKGLRINKSKTEVMGITKRTERLTVRTNIEGAPIKQVASFRYLGSLVTEDGRCDSEIRTRIGMAKSNFGKMRNILTDLSVNVQLKGRLVRSYIWSGMLYGCESWTISATMQKRLEAAEVWFLRRMMRVPWTARRTNQHVLHMARTKRSLMTTIRQRQLGYLGHVLRSRSLAKDCLLGTIEGTRARGRQRMKFMDGMKAVAGCGSVAEITRMAEDRTRWRYIVANVNIQDTARR